MRIILAKCPLLRKIPTLSHKCLVRQTSNHLHYNWHAQKPKCRDFQVILSSSYWSKTIFCIFLKNKYGFQIICFKWLNQLICLSLKIKHVLLKTKDSLLKTEDILLKTKDGPSVNRKMLIHILIYVTSHPPTHRHLTWMITIRSAYGWV